MPRSVWLWLLNLDQVSKKKVTVQWLSELSASVCVCVFRPFFFHCSLESTEDWRYNALLSLGQDSASWLLRIHGNSSAIQTKTQGSSSFMYPLTQPSIYQPHNPEPPPSHQMNSPTSWTMFSKCTSGFYKNGSLTWTRLPEQEPVSQNPKNTSRATDTHREEWCSGRTGLSFTLIHTWLL